MMTVAEKIKPILAKWRDVDVWQELKKVATPTELDEIIQNYISIAETLTYDQNLDIDSDGFYFEHNPERTAEFNREALSRFSKRGSWENDHPDEVVQLITGRSDIRISGQIDLIPFANSLYLLPNLQGLTLREQKAEHIGYLIGRLPELDTLVFQNCGLSELDPKIGRMSQLETVNVSQNRLHSFPDTFYSLSIRFLDFSDNCFDSFPSDLGRNDRLRLIECSGNTIKGEIGRIFAKNSNVGTLCLDENCLVDLSGLRYCKSLDHLEIAGNPIERFPERLTLLTQLKVSPGHVAGLAAAFAAPNRISSLKIVGEGEFDINYLAPLNTLTNLAIDQGKPLNLENLNQLIGIKNLSILGPHLEKLPDALFELPYLESLTVVGSHLQYVPGRWEKLSRLKYLNLSECGLVVIPESLLSRPEIDFHLINNAFSLSFQQELKKKLPQLIL